MEQAPDLRPSILAAALSAALSATLAAALASCPRGVTETEQDRAAVGARPYLRPPALAL